ncbi:MAG: hypothetical protein V9F04_17765 [Dermatophilaceae bacterium]
MRAVAASGVLYQRLRGDVTVEEATCARQGLDRMRAHRRIDHHVNGLAVIRKVHGIPRDVVSQLREAFALQRQLDHLRLSDDRHPSHWRGLVFHDSQHPCRTHLHDVAPPDDPERFTGNIDRSSR